jgi:hypothetical protein
MITLIFVHLQLNYLIVHQYIGNYVCGNYVQGRQSHVILNFGV